MSDQSQSEWNVNIWKQHEQPCRLKLILWNVKSATGAAAGAAAGSAASAWSNIDIVSDQGRTGGKKWPGSYCQTGPLNTRRTAHSIHGTLPTQSIARIDQSVAYLEKYPYT